MTDQACIKPYLYRLAESHLIGQDSAQAVLVQGHQPPESFQLVRLQRSTNQVSRLEIIIFMQAARENTHQGLVGYSNTNKYEHSKKAPIESDGR